MFSKSFFVVALLAVAKLAVATPPACLLGAIATQDDPSQVSEICKNTKMNGYIGSACGDETQQAMSAYAAVCKQAGVQVASSASASASFSSGSSKTNSASATASSASASSDSASATATGKSTATHSGKSSAVTTAKPSTSVVVFTSASYNSDCSCTKTAAFTSTEVSGPTAIVTSGTATGTGSVPQSTGAAGRVEMGAYVAVAGVVAGAFALL